MKSQVDVIIVGTGVAGLYCALNLPEEKHIVLITKSSLEMSDSYLAQGGICVLKDKEDYDSFFSDTMKAGHYKNNPESVRLMILKSPEVIHDLITFGVSFEQNDGKLRYTREGAHSTARILFHEDITGKEITRRLMDQVRKKENIQIMEHTEMIDLITFRNRCHGIVMRTEEGKIVRLEADNTVLATGGIGGLFKDSTNYSHLTGDALALAIRHNIRIENMNYIQIHPTTLYSERPGRRFLISESIRGEGAYLLNAKHERFVDELLPRDRLTQEINRMMKKENSRNVWLSVSHMDSEKVKKRFPHIYQHCLDEGVDITKACIPVIPAQHYFMGGISVDRHSKTSMQNLYAVGETSCNGVHGANRLASNSLLESLVFAREAAIQIAAEKTERHLFEQGIDDRSYEDYARLKDSYKKLIQTEIERADRNERFSAQNICG
ncbi:MAG: L-aspartate oxidase [Oscillospiraceae bacterium]